jgi:hypothetical protein
MTLLPGQASTVSVRIQLDPWRRTRSSWAEATSSQCLVLTGLKAALDAQGKTDLDVNEDLAASTVRMDL